jgi:hypothetical protein
MLAMPTYVLQVPSYLEQGERGQQPNLKLFAIGNSIFLWTDEIKEDFG